jgi:hypothetical protein
LVLCLPAVSFYLLLEVAQLGLDEAEPPQGLPLAAAHDDQIVRELLSGLVEKAVDISGNKQNLMMVFKTYSTM